MADHGHLILSQPSVLRLLAASSEEPHPAHSDGRYDGNDGQRPKPSALLPCRRSLTSCFIYLGIVGCGARGGTASRAST